MRRLLTVGLFLTGCMGGGPGDGSPVDGKWRSIRAQYVHTIWLRDGWYEATTPDAAATPCREAGAYHLDGTIVTLSHKGPGCPGAPVEVEWRGDELWRDGVPPL